MTELSGFWQVLITCIFITSPIYLLALSLWIYKCISNTQVKEVVSYVDTLRQQYKQQGLVLHQPRPRR